MEHLPNIKEQCTKVHSVFAGTGESLAPAFFVHAAEILAPYGTQWYHDSETDVLIRSAVPCAEGGAMKGKKRSDRSVDPVRTGQNLRLLFRESGYHNIDILRALHFESRNSVYDWFAGRSVPTADHLLDLSDLLGCPVESLLVRYGHPSPLQEAAYPGGVIRLGYLRPTKRCMRHILVYGARLLYPMKSAG